MEESAMHTIVYYSIAHSSVGSTRGMTYRAIVIITSVFLTPTTSTTSPSNPPCTTTCCQSCSGPICPVCYQRYAHKQDICPCVNSTQITNNTVSSLKNIDENLIIRSSAQTSDSEKVPICRPSCCPRTSCTKYSCPSCYRKMIRNRKTCPCVNTGRLSNKYFQPG